MTREEVQLLNENTKEFEQVDSLEELFLSTFTNDPSYGTAEYLSATDIWTRLNQATGTGTIGNTRRLGKILKKLGFEKKSRRMGGNIKSVYTVHLITRHEEVKDYRIKRVNY